MPVAALISPPADSISSAIAWAERRRGALEGHVFEEMRDAVFLRALVAGAGLDPDAEGGRLQMRHGVGDDRDAVAEAGDLDAHDPIGVRRLAGCRMKSRTASTLLGRTVKRSSSVSKWVRRLG